VPRPEISSLAPWPAGDIARVLSPCERPLPLLGAGVSAGCGMPTGAALAREIRALPIADTVDFTRLPDRHQDNPLWVSQLVVEHDEGLRRELHLQVARLFARWESEAVLSPALLALARTPNRPSLVLTLNYDRLVEQAAESIGRSCETLGIRDIQPLLNDHLAEPSETLRVLHLHGSLLDDPEELVLDAWSYSRRAEDESVEKLFAAVLPYYNLCILGCSFEEQYLATVMQARRPRKPRHVIVGDEALADRIHDGDSDLSTVQHNILVCDYPAGDHGVLDEFCERLVRCAPPPLETVSMVAVSTSDPDPLYQPRRFIELGERSRRHADSIEISLALGQLQPLDEDALRAEPHAVVVGSPGAGKSRLLQRLAEAPAAGERAVLVRLRDIDEVVGTPDALLRSWLSAGTVLDGGGPIPIRAIPDGEVRAHILLDGLDELPREQRSLVVDAATRIGRAFPDQRFTLSSRPAGELELLPAEWRRLELLCDAEWRGGLLRRLGSDEARLAARLGAVYPKIEPLLRIPFFLRGMHELLEVDRVPRDGLDLALTLLRSLTEQDPHLRTTGATLERWLRQVALTMLLSGSTTLGIGQLRELAADLNLGDPDRVVDLLASRSLLLEAGGEYAFQHRLFAESLAADFLLGEDPRQWLEVLVPEVAGRGALREDWRGVADLLLPRSDSWRAAVAARDPVAVARCTPPDASIEERRRAARELWARAQDLDVWIDPVGPHGGRSDGEVVGALLRDGDLPEVEAEVREALEAESRFRRGNAVDVMAEAEFDGLEDALRRILLEDPDPVVRRSAAVAAGWRQLRGLQDVLEQRALEATTATESRVLATAVLMLAPPEERIERAEGLLRGGNDEIDDHVVVEDLPPPEQLRWLSMRVRDHGEEHWWPRRHLDEVVERLASPTPEQAAQVGLVAAAAGSTSDAVRAFLEEHPAAGAGLVEAIAEELTESYQISDLLLAVGVESLREHGAEEETLEEAEAQASSSLAPAEARRRPAGTAAAGLHLEEILEIEDEERQVALLVGNVLRFSVAARAADEEVGRKLATLLDRVWGEQDLRGAVDVDGGEARIQPWAATVLELGPAAVLELDHDRWLQAALCRWLFTPQISWLREAAEPGWLQAAVAAGPDESLGHLAQIAVERDELEAVVERLLGVDPAELSSRNRERVVESLREARRPDLLRRLAEHDEELGELALPHLAQSGDLAAQRQQLQALVGALEAGARIESPEIRWLDAVDDASLFDLLVRSILLVGGRRGGGPFVDRVLGQLQAAAERADPVATLDLYDRLIAERPWQGAQFLLDNREALLQRLLTRAGARFSASAAERLGLPLPPA
jgi:hypothetical protein